MKYYLERGPIIIVEGEGAILRDIKGKEYIDGTSGNFVCLAGHRNKKIINAIVQQANRLDHTTATLFANVPFIELSRKLGEIAPGGLTKSFFSSSGSDAVETAIRMTRQYFRSKGLHKYIFFSRWLGYHGATLGALSATGTMFIRNKHRPLSPGFLHVFPPYCYRCFYGHAKCPDCNYVCVKVIEDTVRFEGPENIAGIIAEPIMGAGGIHVPPDEYLPMLRELCDRYDMFLIFDEVMTGFGRTGKLWASEHWNVVPDIMTVSKGISSGYASIAGTLTSPKVYEAFLGEPEEHKEFTHGHSFGASSPIDCAAALANIDFILENKLWERSAELGDYVLRRYREMEKELPVIGNIRGRGLFTAVEIVRNKETKEPFPPEKNIGRIVEDTCWNNGLLAWCRWGYPSENLCFCPPLVITKEQVDKSLDVIYDALKKISALI